jgi:hypothetical protein
MDEDRSTQASRQRAHAERMLARAQKKASQASKLVEKWKKKINELDRIGVAAMQARLWSEDNSDEDTDVDPPSE